MKEARFTIAVLCIGLALSSVPAGAEWVSGSQGLEDVQMKFVTPDPFTANTVYSGSKNKLYKSLDGAKTWKRILSLRGNHELTCVLPDAVTPGIIYLGMDSGVKVSLDGGLHWKDLWNPISKESAGVFSLATSAKYPHLLFIGTANGLKAISTQNEKMDSQNFLEGESVCSIDLGQSLNAPDFVITEKGIYKSEAAHLSWSRVFSWVNRSDEEPLQQFGVEEIFLSPSFSSVVRNAESNQVYALTQKGLVEGDELNDRWEFVGRENFSGKRLSSICRSTRSFYVATDRGVLGWNPETKEFKNISEGLGSLKVTQLSYSTHGDYLIAATDRGIFKWSYPDLKIESADSEKAKSVLPEAKNLLYQFSSEPSIRDIQNAAITYAEVHPDKIQAWRKAAAKKAILPSVSLGGKRGENQNIDLDRGGTDDPDHFIQGPNEKNFDWSVSMSWDLGDLVWNDDQTSIDTRSKLMTELRDDVVNEVTHLYYERRRLQISMKLAAVNDLSVQIEKELKLEELTANIDGLTGGYLSRKLAQLKS